MNQYDPMAATPFLKSLKYYERAARVAEAKEIACAAVIRECDGLLIELVAWFRKTHPTKKLDIVFAMGMERVKVDDVTMTVRDHARISCVVDDETGNEREDLQPIVECLFAVCMISSWYRDGTPNDVLVDPKNPISSHERPR